MTPVPVSVNQAATGTPKRYTFVDIAEVLLESAYAEFDGSGAATSFLPSLAVYSPNGTLLGRGFNPAPVSAGDSAKVTFAPFPLGSTAAPGAFGPGLIYSVTLTADVASVDITNIPQTFRDLQLVASVKTNRLVEPDALGCRVNGDSGGNYDHNQLAYATAGGILTSFAFNQTRYWLGEICTSLSGATVFSALVAEWPGYTRAATGKAVNGQANQNKYPTLELVLTITGGLWRGNSPITRLTFFPIGGTLLKAGSTFTLSGI